MLSLPFRHPEEEMQRQTLSHHEIQIRQHPVHHPEEDIHHHHRGKRISHQSFSHREHRVHLQRQIGSTGQPLDDIIFLRCNVGEAGVDFVIDFFFDVMSQPHVL